MTRAVIAVAALGAGMVGLKLATDAAARANAQAVDQGSGASATLDVLAGAGTYNPITMVLNGVVGRRVSQALQSANVRAALDAIAWAEGTTQRGDGYRVCYGYRFTITDFSDHPRALGVWKGEPLDNLGAAYVGKVSTAAGRYQINFPTWSDARRALGLADFSPASQDAAAVWLLDQCGALDMVIAGRMNEALPKMAARWASMPTAKNGQPTRRQADMLARYTAAGGVMA